MDGAWDGIGTGIRSWGGGRGRDDVGIQIGWLGSLGKERGRWNINRVAVVAWRGGGGGPAGEV